MNKSLVSRTVELLDADSELDQMVKCLTRALALRDLETEEHTRRVTAMTLNLARATGIPKAKLIHISRGAMLHDIGKIGIPDSILHKGSSLTCAEWHVMKLHPVFAYELLFPISRLWPALDIPYFHHEKWDGRGYPRGLKGEEIPLAARLFAVEDVWDAITSNRPYREAWGTEKALNYVKEQSGHHFDPKVVEIFLELIADE